jgi:hypothetical protein
MSMTNLAEIVDQINSEFRVDADGKGFVSIRGAARLADVKDSSILRAFQSAAQNPSGLAQFLIDNGFDPAAQDKWRETGIPDIALGFILEYYAYEAQERYRRSQAKLVCRVFRTTSIRSWIHQITGWKIEQPSQASLVGHWAERQRLFIQRTTIPSGWFCIFQELAQLMWQLENLGYVIPDYSPVDNSRIIPDISIGRMFCSHMRSKGYAVGLKTQKYPHWYPGWKLPVKANIYPNAWLEEFRAWFDNQWKPTRLVRYLGKKDPSSLPSIGKLLGLPEAPIQLKLFQDIDGEILVPIDSDD